MNPEPDSFYRPHGPGEPYDTDVYERYDPETGRWWPVEPVVGHSEGIAGDDYWVEEWVWTDDAKRRREAFIDRQTRDGGGGGGGGGGD